MTKPRISLAARFNTLAQARAARTLLTDQLAGRGVFQEHALSAHTELPTGHHVLRAEWRFNVAAHREALRTWVQNNLASRPGFVSGKITVHSCTHDDEGVQNCRETTYQEFDL